MPTGTVWPSLRKLLGEKNHRARIGADGIPGANLVGGSGLAVASPWAFAAADQARPRALAVHAIRRLDWTRLAAYPGGTNGWEANASPDWPRSSEPRAACSAVRGRRRPA